GVRCQVSYVVLAILLGAISNLLDRTFLGGVTDYFALTDQFPAFNIADLLIIGGVGWWVWRTRRAATPAGT
ncbi:signal peptidase II, partial [Candidatus Uhrbacteria bacterium]|nr:signal peptidase II [Candidatus Uhrbacteria bacterium]